MQNHKNIRKKIEQALDKIRPFLIEDGGNVRLIEITEDFKVKVELIGACKTCAMNKMTFKTGVENAIKSAVPQVISVESVNYISD